MEKLIELLNKHAHAYADHYDDTGEEITITFFSHADNCFQYVCDGGYETLVDDVVISKRFGFIKRLVENDKIEGETIGNYQTRTKLRALTHTAGLWHDAEGKSELECIKETFTDGLLMLLSISDTPIEDLVSYLK